MPGLKKSMAALAVIFAMSVSGPSFAQTATTTLRDCLDRWNESPASSYCTSPEIRLNGTNCDVDDECSITATVTQTDGTTESTTWTPSADESGTANSLKEIDICFSSNSDGSAFEASVDMGCSTTEITSKGAMDGQLVTLAE